MSDALDAVVVGAGPNGLSAAIRLAQAGKKVRVIEAAETPGGGARSAELTLPGFVHDVCSAIHPMAAASPFFRSLELDKFGLTWKHPEIPLAQTLGGGDDGAGIGLKRSIDETAQDLGADGAAWKRLLSPYLDAWDDFVNVLYQPLLQVPKHPVLMGRFGLKAFLPATDLAAQEFTQEPARALFAGCAAHSLLSLRTPLSSSFGLALSLQGHAVGWPAAEGGTQQITHALVKCLRSLGGEVETSHRVTSLRELPASKAVLFDLPPQLVSQICRDALPPRFHRMAERWRRGPGVFKLEYALDGPMPWLSDACRKAGTVHVGASLNEMAESEAAVADGRIADRPFLLVTQQSLFDSTRAPAGKHTLWVYCHTPNGCDVDMTARIEAQLERHAPGFRDLVLARHVRTPQGYQDYNAGYLGGDISGGSLDLFQLVFRPTVSPSPWSTPNPKLYLCGQSTPPGPAVHGMCGYWAAEAALRRSFA